MKLPWSTQPYIRTRKGFAYLSVTMDLFSRKIVGWAVDTHMKSDLLIHALEMARVNRGKAIEGCLVHSDRGVQYASSDLQKKLKQYSLVSSMSRKGNC